MEQEEMPVYQEGDEAKASQEPTIQAPPMINITTRLTSKQPSNQIIDNLNSIESTEMEQEKPKP